MYIIRDTSANYLVKACWRILSINMHTFFYIVRNMFLVYKAITCKTIYETFLTWQSFKITYKVYVIYLQNVIKKCVIIHTVDFSGSTGQCAFFIRALLAAWYLSFMFNANRSLKAMFNTSEIDLACKWYINSDCCYLKIRI